MSMKQVFATAVVALTLLWIGLGQRNATADEPVQHVITVSGTETSPAVLSVEAGDVIIFVNDTDKSVTLEIEADVVPFEPDVGTEPVIPAFDQVGVTVSPRAKGKRIKVTVSGSTSTPTTVDVGSG